MNLAIIAAGESSRMRAEGIGIPKPLVKINGIPLIERIIGAAVNGGVSAICCIVNEQSLELRDFLWSKNFGAQLKLLVRSTPSSMHSLFALAPMLGGSPFCLTTADTVFREEEFRIFLSDARERKNLDGVIAVTEFIDDEKPLCVAMDDKRLIREFSDTKNHYRWATGGIYYFTPRIFDLIETAHQRKIERLRNFLRLLLESHYELEGYPFSKIIDIDHVHDLRVAEEFVRTHEPSITT
jgi:NDP-sugar pyrophosphorylase family protein